MELTNKDKILDISVNLARVSAWIIASDNQTKIDKFLEETKGMITRLRADNVSNRFRPTLIRFQQEFEQLLMNRNKDNKEEWAEQALTWANILQHRAKFV